MLIGRTLEILVTRACGRYAARARFVHQSRYLAKIATGPTPAIVSDLSQSRANQRLAPKARLFLVKPQIHQISRISLKTFRK
jgi:hypothetical protein